MILLDYFSFFIQICGVYVCAHACVDMHDVCTFMKVLGWCQDSSSSIFLPYLLKESFYIKFRNMAKSH